MTTSTEHRLTTIEQVRAIVGDELASSIDQMIDADYKNNL